MMNLYCLQATIQDGNEELSRFVVNKNAYSKASLRGWMIGGPTQYSQEYLGLALSMHEVGATLKSMDGGYASPAISRPRSKRAQIVAVCPLLSQGHTQKSMECGHMTNREKCSLFLHCGFDLPWIRDSDVPSNRSWDACLNLSDVVPSARTLCAGLTMTCFPQGQGIQCKSAPPTLSRTPNLRPWGEARRARWSKCVYRGGGGFRPGTISQGIISPGEKFRHPTLEIPKAPSKHVSRKMSLNFRKMI